MRILTLVILVALISWSIFWWTTSQKMENSVESWFNEQKVGQTRDYKKISISGFPNRIDLAIKDLNVSNSEGKFSLSISLIQFLTLLYNRDSIISVIKPPVDIKYRSEHLTIEGDLLKSSFNLNEKKQIIKLVAEGSNLSVIDPNKNAWEFADLLFAIEKEPDTVAPIFKSYLAINNITIPMRYMDFLGYSQLVLPVLKKVSFESTISFTENLYSTQSPSKISRLDDLIIELDWGSIKSSVHGNLNLSRKKLLNGSFEIMILNWQDLLQIMQKEKFLNKKLFRKIKACFTFIASQNPDANQLLKVPLTVKNNSIFLGPIKIGKINRAILM